MFRLEQGRAALAARSPVRPDQAKPSARAEIVATGKGLLPPQLRGGGRVALELKTAWHDGVRRVIGA